MRAHVPIGFSLPYYSLEGNIVSQELTIAEFNLQMQQNSD